MTGRHALSSVMVPRLSWVSAAMGALNQSLGVNFARHNCSGCFRPFTFPHIIDELLGSDKGRTEFVINL